MAAPQGIAVACDDATLTADPTWVRLDQTYKVTSWSIDRGRSYELDKTGTGTAEINLIDTTGAFDPTNSAGTFYGRVDVLKQAAIALQHPMTGSWSTLFRGFISSIEWVPYTTLKHANVRLGLVDALAILGAAEMVADGSWGDQVVDGNIAFNSGTATDAMQTRINKVLDQVGWPSSLRQIFTGNVKLLGAQDGAGMYAPRSSALSVILDAVDAEFPGVGNFYVNAAGTVAAHGRYARFQPDSVSSTTSWDFTRWAVGDAAAAAANPATVVPIVAPLTVIRDDSNLFTAAIATPQLLNDADAATIGTVVSAGHTAYGLRTWSAENLVTAGGASMASGTAVTKLFSSYYAQNYSVPRTRVGQLTVAQQKPVGAAGTAVWNLLGGVDISDIVTLTTTHRNAAGGTTGGGFNGTAFYVEGVHYDAEPLNATHPKITLTMDVSPASYFSSNVFPVTPTGVKAAATATAKAGTVTHT